MAISRRGIFGVIAGAATVAVAPQEIWTRRSGMTYIGPAMRSADTALLTADDGVVLWTTDWSTAVEATLTRRINSIPKYLKRN
jgi:hypothetical protein